MIQIKTNTNTNLRPSPSLNNTSIKTYPGGSVLSGAEIVTIPADVYSGITLVQKKGDTWLKVTSPQAGYMAIVHKGLPVTTIISDGSTPTPDPTTPRKIVSAVVTYSDGSMERLV